MKNRDEILDRLFRAAIAPVPPKEMPFGFDTRVLALVRASSPNGSVGVYRASTSNDDLPAEYAMADNAIQSSLGE